MSRTDVAAWRTSTRSGDNGGHADPLGDDRDQVLELLAHHLGTADLAPEHGLVEHSYRAPGIGIVRHSSYDRIEVVERIVRHSTDLDAAVAPDGRRR